MLSLLFFLGRGFARIMYDVAVIGAGITGGAVAMELATYDLRIALIEKNTDVAAGTTKANSGIIHGGYDPEPGTLMARYNVLGNRMAGELCANLDVPFKRIGSLVLAFTEEDLETVNLLYARGIKNGLSCLSILNREEVLALEPQLNPSVLGALRCESTGIVSPFEYGVAMCENAVENGAELFLETEVTAITDEGPYYAISTNNPEQPLIAARMIVNAAGVDAASVHDMADTPEFSIQPNKGEYYLLDKNQGGLVSHVVFQCPGKAGKGVLVTPTVHGNLIVGPNAEDVEDGGDVSTSRRGLDFVMETAARSCKGISYRDNIRNFAGNRAILREKDDFHMAFSKNAHRMLNLAGIKSPGLTCAPAIAVDAVKMLGERGLRLIPKERVITTRRRVKFAGLPILEKERLIAQNPAYGRVICRCETVTEGEIVDQLRRPIVPRTLDAIKRRAGAGMGRCQGGFCGPRVHEIIARELGLDPLGIRKDDRGSYILTGITKGGQ